ncbi:MAG: cation diffusion facilitator family transporter [Candidatus Aphodosoma sp.]
MSNDSQTHMHAHGGRHHDHGMKITGSLNTVFIVSISLNIIFVVVEAAVGLWQGSLGLLSDAGHNLSDVFGLVLSMIAFRLSKLPDTKRFTYGYRKSTVLISLLNAIILLVAIGVIVIESIHKFANPVDINGIAVSWTAGIGILINGLTAWLLMKNQKHDLNVRGAFLHMAADTLVSVGVLVSGLVINYTGWTVVDPIVGLVIAAVILFSTWHLLSESLRLSLDAAPEMVSYDEVTARLLAVDGVKGVHHIHIWAISTTETAITLHVEIDDFAALEKIKSALKAELASLDISHSTIEFELSGGSCPDAGRQSCGVTGHP